MSVTNTKHSIYIEYDGVRTKTVKLGNKTYPFSGRIYKGSSKNYFSRPFRSWFVKHVKIDTARGSLIVRADDLKRILGCNQKQLEILLEKSHGDLNTLVDTTFGNVDRKIQQLIYDNRHVSSKKPLMLSDNYLLLRKPNGKIKVFKNTRKSLGRGSFKTAVKFRQVVKNKKLAFVQTEQITDKKELVMVRDEYKFTQRLYSDYKKLHPHSANIPFVKCYAAVDSSKNDRRFGMLLECCDGELFDLRDSLSSEEKGEVFLDALRGIAFMHRKGLIHRDIKLENLLLKDGKVKIIDFGLSVKANDRKAIKKPAGTLEYLPPEMYDLSRYKNEPKKIDSWALGVLLYELHFGVSPTENLLSTKGDRAARLARITIANPANDPVIHTIRHLLQGDPSKRWTVEQALAYLEENYRVNGNILKIGS